MLASGALPMLTGRAFLAALWLDVHPPGLAPIALGTPVLFDVGVYLAVMGSMLTVMFALVRRVQLMPE